MTIENKNDLIHAMDVDGDGKISYIEFSRKLEQAGLKQQTKVEMLVSSLIKTKQQMRMSNAELFKFINKDGGPLVSRDDFKDVLNHLNLKQIRE